MTQSRLVAWVLAAFLLGVYATGLIFQHAQRLVPVWVMRVMASGGGALLLLVFGLVLAAIAFAAAATSHDIRQGRPPATAAPLIIVAAVILIHFLLSGQAPHPK